MTRSRAVSSFPHKADRAHWHAAVCGVLDLMTRSPRHRSFNVADIERVILPPMLQDQAIFLADEGHRIMAYGSIALLTDEAAQGYIDGTRKLQPGDWSEGDQIWLIDAIAPFGHARQLTTAIRSLARERGHAGRHIRFRRAYPDGSTRISKALL